MPIQRGLGLQVALQRAEAPPESEVPLGRHVMPIRQHQHRLFEKG